MGRGTGDKTDFPYPRPWREGCQWVLFRLTGWRIRFDSSHSKIRENVQKSTNIAQLSEGEEKIDAISLL